jgi:parallel beta-helix repeat protein
MRFASPHWKTQDNGAINSWGDVPIEEPRRDAERCGHIIRYNLIADTVGCHLDTSSGKLTAPDPAFTNGIYLDDYTSNCFVYGNIVLRGGIGLMIHAGKNNFCENNIFIDCKYPIRYFDSVSERYANWQMQNFMSGNHFCRNIIYSTRPGDVLMHLGWRFTEKVIARSDENIFWLGEYGSYSIEDPGHQRSLILEDWQKTGYDQHSIVADPLFRCVETEDFNFDKDSPVLRTGFQPIDQSKIGIR